tara:strand:+ start:48 stop:1307 length:1260 start_codon:yes stop_codon:yes gene_type:complete
MNLIDRVILEWSYRTKKGYPDLDNEDDLRIFESLFGYDLKDPIQEGPTLAYKDLSPAAKVVADKIIELIGIQPEQIKAFSANNFNVYVPSDDRPGNFDTLENSGEFGKARKVRSGNWKTNGVIFSLKPTGAKAGEFFMLKPQQLGLTLDKKIPLTQLKQELIRGIKNHKILTPPQKEALLYAVTGTGSVSDKDKEELPNGFFNEVNKNFGEPHGALIYGTREGYDSVEFPEAGNYPLIDYILYNGEDRLQVSAKTAKGAGNTVKYKDVIRLAELADGEIPNKLKEFNNIINANSVITGAFEAIDKFGSTELKKAVEDYKVQYPQYPKLGNSPDDRQSHADRIAIEKSFVKELNSNPEFSFTDLFNSYVAVKYIKYGLDPNSLEAYLKEISQGEFYVVHKSKNSPGHDSDKLGLEIRKSK